MKNYEFVFVQFKDEFGDRLTDSITPDEILSFLTKLTDGTKQTTKRNRYSSLKAFFNYIKNSIDPNLQNPCDTPILRKIFKDRKAPPWPIFEKELIDEIIFKTTNPRNRIMLELMARGGMRIGEVLKIRPIDVQDRKITLPEPKSGKESEVVFIPQKVADRLKDYIKEKAIAPEQRIFPITYNAARVMVSKAGKMVGVNLRPHDLRRFCATYASRAGTPIEIISKILLRHSHLSTTQRYLGKISDTEALKWIENLYG
ncbi:MAG: site-specific integrase [Gammaproteobacteria bacterium]|nr:site-specific integrase [Gammaproteobacteria bacterium]